VGPFDNLKPDEFEAEDRVEDRPAALLGRPSGAVNWQATSPARAADQWQSLRVWVVWFRTTFGLDHRVVPPCWYRHSALVEVLSALRDHWLSAYDPLNSPTAASEWHRVFAQLEPRLREWAARTGCTAGEHRPDVTPTVPDDRDRWERHVRDDAAGRRANSTPLMEVSCDVDNR
jgi:hypothetical protein